jgi:Protein of unknown function (DUF2752)
MEINICPRWLLQNMGLSPDRRIHFALFVSALIILLISPLLLRVPHICLIQALLGIPCPGCGVLHGMAALARMDFAGAWRANPASLFLALLFILQLAARPLALLSAKSRPMVVQVSALANYCVCAVLLSVWIYRLILGGIHGYRLMS